MKKTFISLACALSIACALSACDRAKSGAQVAKDTNAAEQNLSRIPFVECARRGIQRRVPGLIVSSIVNSIVSSTLSSTLGLRFACQTDHQSQTAKPLL